MLVRTNTLSDIFSAASQFQITTTNTQRQHIGVRNFANLPNLRFSGSDRFGSFRRLRLLQLDRFTVVRSQSPLASHYRDVLGVEIGRKRRGRVILGVIEAVYGFTAADSFGSLSVGDTHSDRLPRSVKYGWIQD